ncbi:MAG: undecaprenyldiphospho-muramoylpentapeptide beta-N-acetylglucosaminyltransferase [Ruminococcaceae bacterium]|nr:undecaprenyldiphospho-muramoylpentapeptide beta-N-acetylglucosaminyltransferase [Oscillospiraceae bacterium]
MRVLLSGGGTGGHINPALAIAKRIKKEQPDSVIEFVGTPKGMENILIPREGYKIHHVEVMGFKRSLSPKNLKAAYLAVESVYKAKKIIKEFAPDIVVGTGGYVCWPVLKAASSMGIPTLVHEQNAIAGVTVKMLAKYVDKILLAFGETAKEFSCPEKLVTVGNPVNPAMTEVAGSDSRSKLGITSPYVLSYGGSLGARPINEAVFDMLNTFGKDSPYRFSHAFGRGTYDKWTEKAKETGLDKAENIELTDYIYDMPVRMSAADLVICRAGALTLSELAVLRKPAILIPSPYVANNHQFKNASMYAQAGAAYLLEEKDLTNEKLSAVIEELLSDPGRLSEMQKNLSVFAVSDADVKIYNVIKELL